MSLGLGSATRMSTCTACQTIRAGQAGQASHPGLVHQGYVTPTQKGRELNREDRYRCVHCETKWLRETDRWGIDMGFKLAP